MNESAALFTPTEEFWSYLKKVPKTVQLIYHGAVNPALIDEALRREVNILVMPVDQDPTHFAYDSAHWPLIVGVVNKTGPQTIINARRRGASALYCGDSKFYLKSVGRQQGRVILGVMGHNREKMYFIPPNPFNTLSPVAREDRTRKLQGLPV